MSRLSFDKFVYWLCEKVPRIGLPIGNYYENHEWFQRFTKFGISTLVMFWLIKAPLISIFTILIPSINLIFFFIPSYLIAAFLAGLIVTIGGFILNELWIWARPE